MRQKNLMPVQDFRGYGQQILKIHFTCHEEEQDNKEMTEIRMRLRQAVIGLRERKEIYEKLLEHSLITDDLMNELEAENKALAHRVKVLQQFKDKRVQVLKADDGDMLRKLLAEEEEEEKILLMDKLIDKMKNENQKLTQHNKVLAFEYRHKKGQENQCAKETEKCRGEIQKIKKMEELQQTIKDLREEKRRLCQQLQDKQEEQILAAVTTQILRKTSETMDDIDEEKSGAREWIKISVEIILSILLSWGIMAFVTPVCNVPDPNCSFWKIAFSLVQPFDMHLSL